MTYGLSLIAVAWAYQFYLVWKKRNHSLNPWFLRIFALGMIILTLESFRGIKFFESWVAFVTLILVLLSLWKVQR